MPETPESVRRDETLLTVQASGEFGWQARATSPDGVVEFVPGPNLPPIGLGSAHLFTGTHGDEAAELRLTTLHGTPLRDVTDLRYWTYVVTNNGQQFPYIMLLIDLTGDGTVDDLLFFEPPYQTPTTGNPSLPNQGPTALNTWQRWNALPGGWWSENGIAGATPGAGVKPLPAYLAAQPDARIVNSAAGLGGVRLIFGFASAGDVFDGFVDAFSIGTVSMPRTTTFNFDPVPPPPPPPPPPAPPAPSGPPQVLRRPALFVWEKTPQGVRIQRPFRPFAWPA